MKLINWLWQTSPTRANAQKIYGAIVAQARLPAFYLKVGVPDTLEGRFVMLQLHLFTVLHRLKRDGADAQQLAQELVDLFASDVETVLREQGVGDMRIPKKVRSVVAATHALVLRLERAYEAGCGPVLQQAITAVLPPPADGEPAVGTALADYLEQAVAFLGAQPVAAFAAGRLQFPEVTRDAEAPRG